MDGWIYTYCLLHMLIVTGLKLAGTHPFKYTIEPALPDGLELDETTGEIRGVPVLPQVCLSLCLCQEYMHFIAP
jgi:hypothetical protein